MVTREEAAKIVRELPLSEDDVLTMEMAGCVCHLRPDKGASGLCPVCTIGNRLRRLLDLAQGL